MPLINIGKGSMVESTTIISIANVESRSVKRYIEDARSANMLLEATYGARARSLIVCQGGFTILSSISVESLTNRIRKGTENEYK